MLVRTYRSLDRSIQFFGIKGRFLLPMGILAGASLALSVIVGIATMGIIGIAAFLILFFAGAAVVISIQGRISEKNLFNKLAMTRCPQYIHVKPIKHLKRWKSTEA